MFLFFLLGFALFLLYTLIVAQIDRSERRITITPIQVELLTEAFAKTWNRPPTDEEIEGQIEYFIRDEVFFKEAITMGLDKSDLVVKRRMRQLIELMMDNVTSVYPSESQLNTYLSDNPDKLLDRITWYEANILNKESLKDAFKDVRQFKHQHFYVING